jgi:hypothetical protein
MFPTVSEVGDLISTCTLPVSKHMLSVVNDNFCPSYPSSRRSSYRLVLISQSLTVKSSDPEARKRPSGENVRFLARSERLSNDLNNVPVV